MSRPALLAMIALALTAAASAQQPPPPRTGALASGGTGLIAGRVVDPGSGKPVPGSVVWLQVDIVLRPESPRVMTDGEGRFVFVNVPRGRYSLQSQKLGYVRGFFGQRTMMDPGTELDLGDGQVLTDVALPIWKHAAIGGRVTDEAGEPVVGVSVRAFRKTVVFAEVRFTPNFTGATAITDDRGMYRISSIVPGEYVVAVPSRLATFPADTMADLSNPVVQREAFGAISELGFLGDTKNQQVGASVILTTVLTPVPPTPVGDELPAVYRTTLAPATTKLGDATVVSLRSGEERSGLDISLGPVRAGRVSGRLTAPDGAPGPTAIRLIPSGDAFSSASPGFEGATGLSDAAGRFTLLGVPEGQYFLWVERRTAEAPGRPASGPLLHANELVTVAAPGAADLVVPLRPAPRITVRFYEREDRPARPQNVEILIEPVGMGGRTSLSPEPGQSATVQMAPGRYVVTAYGGDNTVCTAVSRGRDVSDEPIVLATDDVEVTVTCGGQPVTRLTGLVRGENGSPDGDAIVVIFPAEQRFWAGADLRVRRKVSAFPSAAGTFSFPNLPPGDYLVTALPRESSEFWQDPKVLEKLVAAATRISLAQGEARNVDIRTVQIK